MTKICNSILGILIFCVGTVSANILDVPSGPYPTIQSAIDSSAAGDTMLVAPGRYYENINFRGKNIVVAGRCPRLWATPSLRTARGR